MESTNRRRRRQKGYPCNALRLLIRLWGIITSIGKKKTLNTFPTNKHKRSCIYCTILQNATQHSDTHVVLYIIISIIHKLVHTFTHSHHRSHQHQLGEVDGKTCINICIQMWQNTMCETKLTLLLKCLYSSQRHFFPLSLQYLIPRIFYLCCNFCTRFSGFLPPLYHGI